MARFPVADDLLEVNFILRVYLVVELIGGVIELRNLSLRLPEYLLQFQMILIICVIIYLHLIFAFLFVFARLRVSLTLKAYVASLTFLQLVSGYD